MSRSPARRAAHPSRALRRLLRLGLLVGAAGGVALTGVHASGALKMSIKDLGKDLRHLRTGWPGPAHLFALDAVAAAVPPDGTYLLVDDGDPRSGQGFYVRNALAPRRAALLGSAKGGFGLERADVPLPDPLPAWTVVLAKGWKAPRLVDTWVHLSGVPELGEKLADRRIEIALARPVPGESVHGLLAVEGSCREAGGEPCAALRFFVDEEERLPGQLQRGPDGRFSAVIALRLSETGPRTLHVLGRSSAGGQRVLLPRPFEAAP